MEDPKSKSVKYRLKVKIEWSALLDLIKSNQEMLQNIRESWDPQYEIPLLKVEKRRRSRPQRPKPPI